MDSVRHLVEGAPLRVGFDGDHGLAIEVVDLGRTHGLAYRRDLSERNGRGSPLRIGDDQRQLLQVREIFARLLREAHSDIARLSARIRPVPGLAPRERRPQ